MGREVWVQKQASGGKALSLMLAKSLVPLSGANLCSSMVAADELSHEMMQAAVECLLDAGQLD